MAVILIMTSSYNSGDRISPDTWSSHVTSPAYISSACGFEWGGNDYPQSEVFFLTSSYATEIFGDQFEVGTFYYDVSPVILSPHDVLISDTFVPRRNYYVSSSTSEDSTVDVDTFIAKSADYTGLTASISTLDTIELGTLSNVEPDEPPFPDPPPVGPYDMNRFRKTYTNVRVRPRIRKYSSSP
jgi:hypothetical protein